MDSNALINPESPPLLRIRCSEIWGGPENADLDVCTSGVIASVFSLSCDGLTGGDLYYFAVCDSDLLTRVVLADLKGHGHQVSILSEWLFNALRESMGSLDGSSILTELNRVLCEKGLDAITTATVVSFRVGDSNLYVANAGHPPVLLRRKEQEPWERIELQDMRDFADLPLGMFRNTFYQQMSLPLRPGDRLALYTDGLTEGTDSREQEFGEDCLRASLRKHGNRDLTSLKNQLVNDLRQHVGGPFAHDDVTLLLLEILGNSRGQCQ